MTKVLVITEEVFEDRVRWHEVDLDGKPDTALEGIRYARAAMTEVDDDYLIDAVDSYWQKYGGTAREVNYATRFADYLLAHIKEGQPIDKPNGTVL